jgi:aminomethyltransferase
VSLDPTLLKTPLLALHEELGGKIVPFAGYAMPVQYPLGVLGEHNHTRTAAGLFDVSHMGQVVIRGEGRAAALETLVPGDHLFLVVNAACKEQDIAHLKAGLAGKAEVIELTDRALLALQGPKAAEVFARLAPASASMGFMSWKMLDVAGIPCFASRSGYTGEDGFEISVPNDKAEELARKLLAEPEVAAIGLGARDSLRLEAGLCLYGSDLDTTTTPVEANLNWTMSKRRRAEGGFPGAAVVQKQLAEGPARLRVGIKPVDKAPARAHTDITDEHGNKIGEITSGGFGPTVNGPVAMGYIAAGFAKEGTAVKLLVRGSLRDAHVVAMPFAPHRYFK